MIPTWQIMIQMWQNLAKLALPAPSVAVRWGNFSGAAGRNYSLSTALNEPSF